MSPLFLREKGYRFSIFSLEEDRMHVHVYQENIQAKIWLEPKIELAKNNGFSEKQINEIISIVKNNEKDFKQKYREHIG
jgi:hypothetical protein